jgi:hypothetical protein
MLFGSQLKPEILRKACRVALERLVEAMGGNSIQGGQIRIQQHPLPTYNPDLLSDLDFG